MHGDNPATPTALLQTTENIPGPFAGAGTNNVPGTAFDPTGSSGFGSFAGVYNFCIGATSAEIAARSAQNLCGVRGTPLSPGLTAPPLASANLSPDPTVHRLPYDSHFVTTDKDQAYATGDTFSRLSNYGVSGTADFELSPTLALKSITAPVQPGAAAHRQLQRAHQVRARRVLFRRRRLPARLRGFL